MNDTHEAPPRRELTDCQHCDGTGLKVIDHSGVVMIERCHCTAGVVR